MLASKVSSKGQVTLPKKVRDKIGLNAGDMVLYEIKGKSATIRRIDPFDAAFHAALSTTLDEWSSKEDEGAFRDL
jgi:AbrB family looped-hinge helix DNA binding protein